MLFCDTWHRNFHHVQNRKSNTSSRECFDLVRNGKSKSKGYYMALMSVFPTCIERGTPHKWRIVCCMYGWKTWKKILIIFWISIMFSHYELPLFYYLTVNYFYSILSPWSLSLLFGLLNQIIPFSLPKKLSKASLISFLFD